MLDTGVPDLIRRAHLMREIHGHRLHYCGASVALFSAMALEAYPSDLILYLHHFLTPDEPAEMHAALDILKDLEKDKVQLKVKYSILYYVLSRTPIPKGDLVYQDFSLLIDIRNHLAHYKATATAQRTDALDRPEKLVKLLHRISNRKIVDRDIVEDPGILPSTWTMLLDESDTFADWSLRTAQDMLRLIYNAMPDCKTKCEVLVKTTNLKSSTFVYGNPALD